MPRAMFKVERVGEGVSILHMDDGRVNAIGPDFLRGFPEAFAEAAADGRAVVLAGNAKAFSAGLDLKALSGMTRGEVAGLARGFARAFRLPLEHPRPVAAAVGGAAIAGGAVLALACDWRVVAREARVGVTEVPVGVPFPLPVLELVRARLPPHEHAPALLQGVLREGDDLAARGWAHHVAARSEVLAHATRLAQEQAALSRLAFGQTKADLNRALVDAYARFEKDGADAWAEWVDAPESLAAVRAALARLAKSA
jgi:enoyl-CoA hydratase